MLSGPQDRQILVSLWAYSGESSLARWKGCKRKMDKTLLSQGANSTSSVLQLQCPEAEAIQHALTTTPNGAHPPPPSQFIAHHQMGWGSKASTAELTLAVSSDLDDTLSDLLSYMTLLFMSWTATSLVYVKSLQRWKNEYKWLKRGEEDLQKERWWVRACVYFWWQWWWAKTKSLQGKFATKWWKTELQAWRSEEVTQLMQSWKWTPIAPSPIANKTLVNRTLSAVCHCCTVQVW